MATDELIRTEPDGAGTAGRVEAIHIAPAAEAPMVAVDRVHAIAGVGLEGDRYATRTGTWSPDPASIGTSR